MKVFNESWDERYLTIARDISLWSKDPSTKVGAIIVGSKGQILSQGFNGFPRKIQDLEERLVDREKKLKYTVHAEMNCIYNASFTGTSLDDSTLYVYGLPVCAECAKGVTQVGVSNVVMSYPKNIRDVWKKSFEFTKDMFNEAGIRFRCY